jgi:electron transport complex protein RnfG
MMYYLKLGIILFIFCAVASGILAYINTLTAPVIAERKAKEEVATREALIPGATFTEVQSSSGDRYFVAKDPATDEILGYTFIAAEIGYSSTVQTMVGVDKDFKVLAIKVIDQAETPGLGANCTNESFSAQYSGMTLENLYVDKDGGAVVSLSGATITSRCITNSIRNSIHNVQTDIVAGGAQ